jgi:hypothetical protein
MTFEGLNASDLILGSLGYETGDTSPRSAASGVTSQVRAGMRLGGCAPCPSVSGRRGYTIGYTWSKA